jgi:hypothetical protein
MTKLNQILAIERDVRARADHSLATANSAVAKDGPLTGITRTYQPRADDGDQLPSERSRVQYTVDAVNVRLAKDLARLWDVTATKDATNTRARASVVVDGQTILEDVPGPFLIWFEKQLVTLRAYVARLPVLDPAEDWEYDTVSAYYRSKPVVTVRPRKVPKSQVLYPATDHHPAQIREFTVDEPAGDWTTIKFSGAIPEARRLELLDKVDTLIAAVKFAREAANQTDVVDVPVGNAVFNYLFA